MKKNQLEIELGQTKSLLNKTYRNRKNIKNKLLQAITLLKESFDHLDRDFAWEAAIEFEDKAKQFINEVTKE